jgi:hypothetical protein
LNVKRPQSQFRVLVDEAVPDARAFVWWEDQLNFVQFPARLR